MRAAIDLQFAQQAASEGVVVGAALQVPTAIVVVFFQPEGIDGQAGGRADDAALEAALAAAVVAVPGLIGIGNLLFDQLVERVGGEGGRLVVVTAAAEVAPGVVLGAVGRRAGVGGGSREYPLILWRAYYTTEPASLLDNLRHLLGLPE